MGSEKEIQRLEEEVQILEDLVAQDALLARRASRNSTIVSLSLCFVIFVFVAANAVNIAMEFTEERIADSLEAELREFSPVAIRELKILGLPTSLLIDSHGNEVGRVIGPAEWDSPTALELIRRYTGGSSLKSAVVE